MKFVSNPRDVRAIFKRNARCNWAGDPVLLGQRDPRALAAGTKLCSETEKRHVFMH